MTNRTTGQINRPFSLLGLACGLALLLTAPLLTVSGGQVEGAGDCSWAPVATPDGVVDALEIYDDGGGDFRFGVALYAAGAFTEVDGLTVDHVARWDGVSWSAVEGPNEVPGTDRPVLSLATWRPISSEQLFLGGTFTFAGTQLVNNVATFNGAIWNTLSENFDEVGTNGDVLAMTVFDDGSSEALYVGGSFTIAGGKAVGGIASWRDPFQPTWSPVGPSGTNGHVNALTVFDDGSGAALYVGGGFSTVDGITADGLARWNGTAWSAIPGSPLAPGSEVLALAVFDDGTGPALYVASDDAGQGHLNRWNGTSWETLYGPSGTGTDGPVRVLRAFDDGTGGGLVAGGDFTTAGGLAVANLATWTEAGWEAKPAGGVTQSTPTGQVVRALEVFEDGGTSGLWVGGDFDTAGGMPSPYLAVYSCAGLFADGFESGDTSEWSSTTP